MKSFNSFIYIIEGNLWISHCFYCFWKCIWDVRFYCNHRQFLEHKLDICKSSLAFNFLKYAFHCLSCFSYRRRNSLILINLLYVVLHLSQFKHIKLNLIYLRIYFLWRWRPLDFPVFNIKNHFQWFLWILCFHFYRVILIFLKVFSFQQKLLNLFNCRLLKYLFIEIHWIIF